MGLKRPNIILYGVFLALIPGLAAIAASCQDGSGNRESISTADVPDQEFSDFTTSESDSGLVRWVLKAPVARVYNARKLLVTDTPHIEFFDTEGILTSVLTSDKGEYNQVTHDLTALGHVFITSQEGYVLETESLVWVNELGEIHSEDFVKFTRGRDVLTGIGLRGDPELRNVEIRRDVKAYLRDEDGMLKEEIQKEEGSGVKQGE
ncbi:MAG: LPS export ABC transporter periplasmic protein LptC [Candidatus Krumholzibacteria bacterium]|nr:LPS export ABC transporter periplasmic protein LptC [Candidatus Krumholzibacteria bacterium]